MSKQLRTLAVLLASIALLSQIAVPLLAAAQDAPDCQQQPDVCQAMLDQYTELYGPLPEASPTSEASSPTPPPALAIGKPAVGTGGTLTFTNISEFGVGFYLFFEFTNTSNLIVDFRFGPSTVDLTDDLGTQWKIHTSGLGADDQRYLVEPGDTVEMRIPYRDPNDRNARIAIVEVTGIDGLEGARWEFIYESDRV